MQIEHANMTVPDIQAATEFLLTAFPEARVRGEGKRPNNGLWRHVGSDSSYIALQQEVSVSGEPGTDYTQNGVNHLGFVVGAVAPIEQRLTEAGFQLSSLVVNEPNRKARYFYDSAGFEWEFVEYLFDTPEQRNRYD